MIKITLKRIHIFSIFFISANLLDFFYYCSCIYLLSICVVFPV